MSAVNETVYRHILQAAKGIGAPMDWFRCSRRLLGPMASASRAMRRIRMRRCCFMNTCYRQPVRKTLASLGYVPTTSGLPSLLPPNLTIKLVDPVLMLDQVEKWNKSFQEIFVKRSGQ